MSQLSRRQLLKQAAAAAAAAPWVGKRVYAQVSRPIRVGVAVPLTGNFTEPGRNMLEGYRLWAETVNSRGGLLGRQVELMVEDDRSSTEVVVAQVERFINVHRVDLLFPTYSSLLTFPASAVAERYQMVYPVAAGVASRIWNRGFKYIFCFQQKLAEDVAENYFNVLAGSNIQPFPKTMALTYVDDFFANAIATGVPTQAQKHNIRVVETMQVPMETTDYLSLTFRLRQSGAEFWLAAMAGAQAGINFARAAITVGYQPLGVGMSSAPAQPEFKDALGDKVNGVFFHAAWHPAVKYRGEHITNQEFVRLFRERYGNKEISEDHAIAFAVGQGMQYAVEHTGTLDNRALRDFLASRTERDPVPTILGNFHWDPRGVPVGMDYVVVQWQNGRHELVWPPDTRTAELLWPKPRW